jgi:hypothetical protein
VAPRLAPTFERKEEKKGSDPAPTRTRKKEEEDALSLIIFQEPYVSPLSSFSFLYIKERERIKEKKQS